MAIFRSGNSYGDTPAAGATELVSAFGKLVPKPAPENRLDAPAIPPSIVAQQGLSPVARPTGNGNIASPLTETAYADREFYTEQTSTSTDGVFTVAWKPIRVTKFADANGNPVVIQYAEPD